MLQRGLLKRLIPRLRYGHYGEDTVTYRTQELFQKALLSVDAHVTEFLPLIGKLIDWNIYNGSNQFAVLTKSSNAQIWKEIICCIVQAKTQRFYSVYRDVALSIV